VLGIDNVIFISILVDRLPAARREFARRIGLFLAMFMRIGLLLVLAWLVVSDRTAGGYGAEAGDFRPTSSSSRAAFSCCGKARWRSISSWKATKTKAAGRSRRHSRQLSRRSSSSDIVFSLDSIITAVGMVQEIAVMVAAVIASVGLMMLFAGAIGRFARRIRRSRCWRSRSCSSSASR
jgi:hypothetical protein